MGKIYDLTYEDVKEIIQEITENNIELKNWCKDDAKAEKVLESIFYIEDAGTSGGELVSSEDGYYGIGTRASLYIKDSKHHVCAKSMVIDFMKIIFSPEVWKCVKDIYCKFKNIPGNYFSYVDLYVIVIKVKEALVKNVIKLSDENFCFYLQMVTHFREHGRVALQEIVEWIPNFMGECCWAATDWKCQFCETGKCTLKGKDNYEKVISEELEKMVEDRLLIPAINEDGVYKINY